MATPATVNQDEATVRGFGDEWSTFDQSTLDPAEAARTFEQYFAPFDWSEVGRTAEGFDLGCGSGRWARFVAPRVGLLHCIDASRQALTVAERNLADLPNCRFHHASVDRMPCADNSMDFGYSLGVLHHVPDTQAGLAACVRKLRPGAPFLLYLYYAFDNQPSWYRGLWQASDVLRRVVSRLPFRIRVGAATMLAATVYWPLARTARMLERQGTAVSSFPLAFYRNRSFYTMRTDALDRFGTRLEQRFTRTEIRGIMEAAGLVDIRFSDAPPFWCAVGRRANTGT
jgi:ubiquinone/menaquinone biosynthesis C-methylase UbiE